MHRHEWGEHYITIRHVDILQVKCDCGEQMYPEEIIRRLNATEILPAYAADMMGQAQMLYYEEGQGGYSVAKKLIEYAKALGYEIGDA